MEKWMIVYLLPLEVWVDIFCFPWITRREFGKLVDRIGNHKFAEHAQFFLHEWGKRKISFSFVFRNRMPLCLIEQPRTPLPTNIKSFDGEIRIGHFDAKTMDFLNNFRPMLTDVKMMVIESAALEDLRTILTNLAPMLDGICVLEYSGDLVLPMVKQFFTREQFAKLRVLKYSFSDSFSIPDAVQQERVKNLVDWLTSPGQDNNNDGPKLCVASTMYSYNGFIFGLLRAIRQQFLAAKTPCTFALIMKVPPGWRWQSVDFHPLENSIGEQLRLEWTADGWQKQVVRHRANCNTELQEWINENMKRKICGCIRIRQLTIGPIASAAAQVDVPPTTDEEQNIQQQPCSSKDA